MNYIPHTEADRKEMLAKIGIESKEQLFDQIPNSVKFEGELNLPAGISELELKRLMKEINLKNGDTERFNSFLGAGTYEHYIPSVVGHILQRSEFYTAYTPYQPEISQGTLQVIYEFQSLICELTGMDVANASMYDGASAAAEAVFMACGQTKNNKVVISTTVHPEYRQVVNTYAATKGIEVVEVGMKDGTTDLDALAGVMDDDVAAVLFQQPNFFGCLEDTEEINKIVKQKGSKRLLVPIVDPISLGILRPPADYGADIVVGDAQGFGNSMSYGGPHVGFFAVTKKLVRKIPGRVAGRTVDKDGKPGFVLTLQAREQHIRRDKATSNICSNQALAALAATIAMVTLGKQGIQDLASQCIKKANYTLERLCKLKGVERAFTKPIFKEFVVKTEDNIDNTNKQLLKNNIIGGLNIGCFYSELNNHALLCVTEVKSKQQIDELIAAWEGLK
ncbi:glycine dehydrogenase subunit 1 [Desulfitispora alkaliphila]|uniref:aminomethyl-transferring glycine dehydrogenase subunit GcvPA n=1 Tax=Desulfitispora alkaliphila TaxID=622674 RepID=UPI003D1E0EF6